MPLRFPVRTTASAVLAAALLASCAEAPPPVLATPPAAPPITLSSRVVEMASAYKSYVDRTTAIAPTFSDAESVRQSLQTGVAYEPSQMAKGAIAYAAVVALQDRAFVEGVRVYAKDPVQRRQIAHEIMKDPAYAIGIEGSASAAGLVIAAIGGEARRLYDGGKAVKQSAYEIQKQPWSKAEVAGRDARLAHAKSLGSAAMHGDVEQTARLQQASMGTPVLDLTPTPASPPYTPTVVRGLAVAALAALGEAGDANLEQVMGLVAEPNTNSCMSMARLNLYQCLAVARPNYEDVFCLGQHAMMDTGRCMIRATGLPEPHEPRFVPSADSAAKGYNVKKPPAKKTRRKS